MRKTRQIYTGRSNKIFILKNAMNVVPLRYCHELFEQKKGKT